MWRWLSKYFALRSYRRKLGPALVTRYGRQRHYTANQVRVTAEKVGLDPDYVCYGLAAFCDEQAFNAYHRETGEDCSYAHMREQVEHHHITHHHESYGHSGHDGGGHHHGGEHHHDGGHHHDSGHSHDGGGGFDGGGHHH